MTQANNNSTISSQYTGLGDHVYWDADFNVPITQEQVQALTDVITQIKAQVQAEAQTQTQATEQKSTLTAKQATNQIADQATSNYQPQVSGDYVYWDADLNSEHFIAAPVTTASAVSQKSTTLTNNSRTENKHTNAVEQTPKQGQANAYVYWDSDYNQPAFSQDEPSQLQETSSPQVTTLSNVATSTTTISSREENSTAPQSINSQYLQANGDYVYWDADLNQQEVIATPTLTTPSPSSYPHSNNPTNSLGNAADYIYWDADLNQEEVVSQHPTTSAETSTATSINTANEDLTATSHYQAAGNYVYWDNDFNQQADNQSPTLTSPIPPARNKESQDSLGEISQPLNAAASQAAAKAAAQASTYANKFAGDYVYWDSDLNAKTENAVSRKDIPADQERAAAHPESAVTDTEKVQTKDNFIYWDNDFNQ